jgi:hypothetical protein
MYPPKNLDVAHVESKGDDEHQDRQAQLDAGAHARPARAIEGQAQDADVDADGDGGEVPAWREGG